MKTNEAGQTVIIAGLVLSVLLFILAVTIELSRLFLIQGELDRAAEAAGKAGLVLVGDQMMIQEQAAQTGRSDLTQTPALSGKEDEYIRTLTAPPMQTAVAGEVYQNLEENGYGSNDQDTVKIEIQYPAEVPEGRIAICVRLEYFVNSLFKNIFFIHEGVLVGQSIQTILSR